MEENCQEVKENQPTLQEQSVGTQDHSRQEVIQYFKDSIDRMLNTLAPNEADIFRKRFGLGDEISPRTSDQVAEELTLTPSEVARIEHQALLKLKYRHLV